MYTAKMNRNENYGLWGIMMCRHRFVDGKRCTVPVRDLDGGRGGSSLCGARRGMGTLYLPLNCTVNLKLL